MWVVAVVQIESSLFQIVICSQLNGVETFNLLFTTIRNNCGNWVNSGIATTVSLHFEF